MRRKTLLNILLILVVLSFFVTPLGYHGKILLNRIFSFSPEVEPPPEREMISDYNWKLKDADWEFINFERSRGRVVFINFWASWRLPSAAELRSIQNLYNRYGNEVDFYIITNEEQEPVLAFMEEEGFTFPVTYLIIGEKSPVETADPPRSYVIARDGSIVVRKEGIADWDNQKVFGLLDELLKAE
jgi:thiol-disulfide isomerase/thioredoxin